MFKSKIKLKFFSVLMVVMILISSLSMTSSAFNGKEYIYTNHNGDTIPYYKDINGDTYILDNGEREYIVIPDYTVEITDIDVLNSLREEFNEMSKQRAVSNNLPYSKTMDLTDINNSTSILCVNKDYFYLKCSQLNPSNGKRGFSYYIYYSPDGVSWSINININKSLLVNTKHRMSELGNAQYIKIHMWSYYQTVNSCLLSVS